MRLTIDPGFPDSLRVVLSLHRARFRLRGARERKRATLRRCTYAIRLARGNVDSLLTPPHWGKLIPAVLSSFPFFSAPTPAAFDWLSFISSSSRSVDALRSFAVRFCSTSWALAWRLGKAKVRGSRISGCLTLRLPCHTSFSDLQLQHC